MGGRDASNRPRTVRWVVCERQCRRWRTRTAAAVGRTNSAGDVSYVPVASVRKSRSLVASHCRKGRRRWWFRFAMGYRRRALEDLVNESKESVVWCMVCVCVGGRARVNKK